MDRIEKLPVMRLNYNVTQFLSMITTIDIRAAINKGLKNEIIFAEEIGGDPINASCSEDGQVYLSPSFAQAVWNMCYAGLKLADYNVSKEECIKEKSSLDFLYQSIIQSGCVIPECLYIKGLVEAICWEEMLDHAVTFLRNWAIDKDYDLMGSIDICATFESRVNGMYMVGMGGILLHELTHFDNDHFNEVEFRSRKSLEQEADDRAFDAIMALPEQYQQSGVMGSLCNYLLMFYKNPKLIPNDNYFREDERLFAQFDKINNPTIKRKANILVAYVLSQWLREHHKIKVEVVHNQEEKAVKEIRGILNGM